MRPRRRRDARASDVTQLGVVGEKVIAQVDDWTVEGNVRSLGCNCSTYVGCAHVGAVLLAISDLGSPLGAAAPLGGAEADDARARRPAPSSPRPPPPRRAVLA